MVTSDKISKLLAGAIDLHVHSGPGLIPRSLDHAEAARDAIDAGLRAIVVKDQHSMTCHAVYLVRKHILKDSAFDIFGGMVLNNATGGLNPHTVDGAIKSGAKIIWMPTASAENHIETHKRIHTEFPKTREKLLEEIPLKIIDKNGNLLPQISTICRLIAEADVILGTGHLYLDEIKLLVAEAQKQGVKKILMQHPEFLINATVDEMIEFANKGVFIEHSMVFYVKGTIDKEYLLEMVKKVGAERTTLGSDLGQIGNPLPMEGIRSCVKIMLEMGISDEEIDLMIRKNPAKLLNLQ
jgi:hypothetical protein